MISGTIKAAMVHHVVDNMQSFELIQDHEMGKIWSIRAAAFWSDQKYALNLFRWHAHAPPPCIRECRKEISHGQPHGSGAGQSQGTN